MFVKSTLIIPITLNCCWIGNTRAGIEDFLSTLLLKYSGGLHGCVVSFKIIAHDKIASILNECPSLQLNATIELVSFSPCVNSILTGVVSKLSRDHIGVLVYGIFNASISLAELEDYTFDYDRNVLYTPTGTVSSGSVIRFAVDSIDVGNDSWSINGSLSTPECGVVTCLVAPPSVLSDINYLDNGCNDSYDYTNDVEIQDKVDLADNDVGNFTSESDGNGIGTWNYKEGEIPSSSPEKEQEPLLVFDVISEKKPKVKSKKPKQDREKVSEDAIQETKIEVTTSTKRKSKDSRKEGVKTVKIE